MARTVYANHERYLNTYMKPYPGYYFTGDGAKRDKDGMYWITGRVDDVVNVSGHRLGTAEIESCLATHPNIAEAACIGIPDEVKGQAIFAYAIATATAKISDELKAEIKQNIRKKLGAFCTPKHIMVVKNVPKTRSGKIMRRILRKVACEEFDNLGDVTTLADPS